jgi:hypothetical protein
VRSLTTRRILLLSTLREGLEEEEKGRPPCSEVHTGRGTSKKLWVQKKFGKKTLRFLLEKIRNIYVLHAPSFFQYVL